MQKVAVVMDQVKIGRPCDKLPTQLEALDIPYEKHVISAHRMPDQLAAFGKHAADQGFGVIIAGAVGAAHYREC